MTIRDMLESETKLSPWVSIDLKYVVEIYRIRGLERLEDGSGWCW